MVDLPPKRNEELRLQLLEGEIGPGQLVEMGWQQLSTGEQREKDSKVQVTKGMGSSALIIGSHSLTPACVVGGRVASGQAHADGDAARCLGPRRQCQRVHLLGVQE